MGTHTLGICLLILSVVYINEAAVSKNVRTLEFVECTPPGTPRAIDYSKAGCQQSKGVFTFNGTVDILNDYPAPLKVTLQHFRFETSSDPKKKDSWVLIGDSFEYDMCKIFKGTDGDAYTHNFFNGLRPKLSCPVQKGTYTITDSKGDLGDFLSFPVEGFKWKLTTKIKSGAKVLFCNTWIIRIDAQGSRKT